MFENYLSIGGVEIANVDRLLGYINTAPGCVFPQWVRAEGCGTLQEALGHNEYTIENIDEAPWYDPTRPDVSSRFYGLLVLDVAGVHDSTLSIAVQQAIGEGGVLGQGRFATKDVKVKALLLAQGDDAIDYGLNWLNSQLRPGACGQHGSACGLADLAFLVTCPPEMIYRSVRTEGNVLARNHFTNPFLEGSGTWHDYAVNLVIEPLLNTAPFHWEAHQDIYPMYVNGLGARLFADAGDVASGTTIFTQLSGSANASIIAGGAAYEQRVRVTNDSSSETISLALVMDHSTGTEEGPTVVLAPNDEVVLVQSGVKPVGATSDSYAGLRLRSALPFGDHSITVRNGWTVQAGPASSFRPHPDLIHPTAALPADGAPRFAWSGAVNESTGAIQYEGVRGLTTGVGWIITPVTRGGTPAALAIPTGNVLVPGMVSLVDPIPDDVAAGGTFRATIEFTGSTGATTSPAQGRIGVFDPETLSDQVLGEGVTDHSVDATGVGSPKTATIFLDYADTWPTRKAYISNVALIEGDYTGPVFTGDTVPQGAQPTVDYRWVGTPGESISEAYEVSWVDTPDPDAYDPLLRGYERYLHDVGVTSPPTVRQYHGGHAPEDGKIAEVEFTVTSERGYVYERAKPVTLLTTADAFEEVDRNLFINPTTDTAGPVAVLRRNLVPNPSLETAVTGWSMSATNSDSGAVTPTGGRVSGEMRASGSYSMKAAIPTPGSGSTTTYITWSQTVPAGGREVLVGIWGAVSDPSGQVSYLAAQYRIGTTGSWIDLEVPTPSAAVKAGHTYKSGPVALPAGATTTVQIRFVAVGFQEFTAYADAAMLIEG